MRSRSHPPHQRRATTLVGHSTRRTGTQRPVLVPAPPNVARRQAEIEQELQLARDIQQGLLLETVPHITGWEISAVSLPARDLGGDLYDFLPIGGQQGIMIGDVSGKGLPAALRMAVARTVFRYQARREGAPGETLAGTNRSVLSEVPQGMVTMLYALLDPWSGSMQIANAGHNYPLLLHGAVDEIELTGLPLGVDGDSEYSERHIQIQHGDTIVFYTDGIPEAVNPHEEMFGDARMMDVLRANGQRKPRALVAALLYELRAWSGTAGQSDDITMVVVRRQLQHLDAELRSVADDVLGVERADAVWQSGTWPSNAADIDAWTDAMISITQAVQERYGRGLGRELYGQMRLVLEEYRDIASRSSDSQPRT